MAEFQGGGGWQTIKKIWDAGALLFGAALAALGIFIGLKVIFSPGWAQASWTENWGQKLGVLIFFLWGVGMIGMLIYFLFFRQQHRR